MSNILSSRISRLEASTKDQDRSYPRVVRLVAKEGQEAEAIRSAETMGIDASPAGNNLVIIRVIKAPAH